MKTRGWVTGVCLGAVVLGVAGCGSEEKSSPTPTETLGAAPSVPAQPTAAGASTASAGASGPASLGATESDRPGAGAKTSPTAAPTGAPVMPATAKQNTKAGAEAFARWYIETLSYRLQYPAEDMPAVGLPSCKVCKIDSRAVQQSRIKGVHTAGPRMTVNSVQSQQMGKDWFVDVSMRENPVALLDANGKEIKRRSAATGIRQPQLRWNGTAWRIVEIRAEVQG